MMIHRIEILQKIRQDELDRKKVEERRRLERGLRDSVPRVKRDEMVECLSTEVPELGEL